MRNYPEQEYVELDGVIAEFHFPYSGYGELFYCSASTFSVSGYPQIELRSAEIVLRISKTIDETKHISKEKLFDGVKHSLESIKNGMKCITMNA